MNTNWWELPKSRWVNPKSSARRPRDSQRSKLYTAEREAFGDAFTEPVMTLDEVSKFLRKLRSYVWFQRRWGKLAQPEVLDGKGRFGGAVAYRYQWRIYFPEWSRTLPIVLHEFAHLLNKVNPGHGRMFARTYVELVHHVIGKEEATKLKQAFRKHRVKFNPYPTPEARIRASERMRIRRREAARTKQG